MEKKDTGEGELEGTDRGWGLGGGQDFNPGRACSASGAGGGVSAHHCTLFLVRSHQTGHLQVSTFRMPFHSAEPWKRSQGGRPRCSPGPDSFPGVTELP